MDNQLQAPSTCNDWQDEIATQTYQTIVTSMIEWVAASKRYLKCRRHLSSTEKEKAIAILSKRERLLTSYHLLYKPKARDLERALNDEYQKQANENQYAEYYEFPPFPLPELPDFYLPEPFNAMDFRIANRAFTEYIQRDDELVCRLISPLNLESGNLIAVMHRRNRNYPRRLTVGWFGKIEFGFLILLYDNPKLSPASRRKPIFIPDKEVLRIYKATKLVRYLEDKKEVSHE